MIPAFNTGGLLDLAVRSVLEQDPGPVQMQIEVVDDHSDIDPTERIHAIGNGRVTCFRQPANVGSVANFATCINRARGRLVHLLHADDLVQPGFYAALGAAFDQVPSLGAAFCRSQYIDADGAVVGHSPTVQSGTGLLANATERLGEQQVIMTPGMVVRRQVYEALGGFDQRLLCSEDWEMWVRIAAHYPVWYEARPLASYRMHGGSKTAEYLPSAGDTRYSRLAIELFTPLLPVERARQVSRKARRTYARSSLDIGIARLALGEMQAAAAHFRESFLLSPAMAAWSGLREFARIGVAAWTGTRRRRASAQGDR